MKNNNKKRRQRKIFLLILMIIFTGVVLTTSTYAWFTANRTVTVSNIDVNVAASNGLQVSVDGINWKTVISNADITGASATYPNAHNQLPNTLNSMTPVSTVGDLDSSGFMQMYAGEIESSTGGTYILSAEKEPAETHRTEGKYIAFDLFFQVTTTTPIYLSSNSNVVARDTSTGIENAARVAFIKEGVTSANSPTSTIQSLLTTESGPTTVFFWEPNYDVHTLAAVSNASSNYGVTTTTTSAERIAYVGVRAPISTTANIPLNSKDTTYFAAVNPQITSVAAGIPSATYAPAFSLEAGVSKVRIYMWIEGQDVDCENNASGGSLTYNLQFTSNSSAG